MSTKLLRFIKYNPLLFAMISVLVVATIVWATEWQNYGTYSAEPASGDTFLLNDISNSPPGTLTQLSWTNLETYVASDADYWVGSAQAYLSDEIVVNDESSLYAALSGVDRFFEFADPDPTWGVNDTTRGSQIIYGDNSTGGGNTSWYNGASDDGSEDYWRIEPDGTTLNLGPASDTTLYTFDNAGTFGASGLDLAAVANPVLTLDDTSGDDFSIDLDSSNADFIMGSTSIFDIDTTDIVVNVPIDSSDGLEATYIDAGVKHYSIGTDTSMDTAYPDLCKGFFMFVNSGTMTVTLPTQPLCNGTAGVSKVFCFKNRGTHTVQSRIDPFDSNEAMILTGNVNPGDAGDYIYTAAKGDAICIRGTAGYWRAVEEIGTGWTYQP